MEGNPPINCENYRMESAAGESTSNFEVKARFKLLKNGDAMEYLSNGNETESLEVKDNDEVKIATDTAISDIAKVESPSSDNPGSDAASSDTAKDEIASEDTAEITLREGVTKEPRNDEEAPLGPFLGNQTGLDTYLDVSDDNGEMLGVKDLMLRVREFTKRYSDLAAAENQDLTGVLRECANMAKECHTQLNVVENKFGGATNKCRILEGAMFNKIQDIVDATGQNWLDWFKETFGSLRELRSVQDYKRIASIPRSIAYAVLGKERIIQTVRQLTDDDKKTDDPIGTFIARNGFKYNPEEAVDVEELKIEADISIEYQKLLNEEIEVPKMMIDTLVRNGMELTPDHIRELKYLKSKGDNIVERFEEIVASDEKYKKRSKPQEDAEWFVKKTVVYISAINSAIKKPECLHSLKLEHITTLRERLQLLEQRLKENTQNIPGGSGDAAKLSLEKGGN